MLYTYNNEIIGYCEITKGEFKVKCRIVRANCLCAILAYTEDNEDVTNEENCYYLQYFFNDETHLKNCLGLTKQYNKNIIDNINNWKLNVKFKESQILLKNLIKIKNIVINVINE